MTLAALMLRERLCSGRRVASAEVRHAGRAVRQCLDRRHADPVCRAAGADGGRQVELGPGLHAHPLRLEGRAGGAGQRRRRDAAVRPRTRGACRARPAGAVPPLPVPVVPSTCCSWCGIVAFAHHPAVFMGLFLFFMGFATAYPQPPGPPDPARRPAGGLLPGRPGGAGRPAAVVAGAAAAWHGRRHRVLRRHRADGDHRQRRADLPGLAGRAERRVQARAGGRCGHRRRPDGDRQRAQPGRLRHPARPVRGRRGYICASGMPAPRSSACSSSSSAARSASSRCSTAGSSCASASGSTPANGPGPCAARGRRPAPGAAARRGGRCPCARCAAGRRPTSGAPGCWPWSGGCPCGAPVRSRRCRAGRAPRSAPTPGRRRRRPSSRPAGSGLHGVEDEAELAQHARWRCIAIGRAARSGAGRPLARGRCGGWRASRTIIGGPTRRAEPLHAAGRAARHLGRAVEKEARARGGVAAHAQRQPVRRRPFEDRLVVDVVAGEQRAVGAAARHQRQQGIGLVGAAGRRPG
jgi:hypothetical protein